MVRFNWEGNTKSERGMEKVDEEQRQTARKEARLRVETEANAGEEWAGNVLERLRDGKKDDKSNVFRPNGM